MTSKEYLQQIATTEVIDCTYNDNSKKRIADIFSVGIEVIKKDLEVLEILKEHYDVNFLEVSPNYFIAYSVYKDDEDFKKVKEWLENENTK